MRTVAQEIAPQITLRNCSKDAVTVVVVQSLSHEWLFVTPQNEALQPSLSFTISQSLFKLMSTESVMPSKHLILCRPLLLLYSIFPSFRAFSNESYLHISWSNVGPLDSPSVLPINIQDWFPLQLTGLSSLQSKGLSRAFYCMTVWKQQFYGPQLFLLLLFSSHIHTGLLKKPCL